MIKDVLKLLRFKHYIKNVLILAPLFFSGSFFSHRLSDVMLSALIFCIVSSVIYIFNDLSDIEKDRMHPSKKNRPLASGRVTQAFAMGLICALIITSGLLFWLFNRKVESILCTSAYIAINILYSRAFKNIPLLDVLILVFGYIIRLYYGAIAADVDVSGWLYLTVMSMAFYLGLCKRRNELSTYGESFRPVLKGYTRGFLDKNMYMCLTLSLIFYSLWCSNMQQEYNKHWFLYTIPLTVVICMKYNMNVERESDGDPIEVVYEDKVLLGLMAAFAIMVVSIIYFI